MPARPLPLRAIARSAFLVALAGLAVALVGALPNVDVPPTGQEGRADVPAPYSQAPTFTLPTDGGDVLFGEPGHVSTIFLANNPLGSLGPTLWGGSVGELIAASPDGVRYAILSYADTDMAARADVESFRVRVESAVAALPEPQRAKWADRFVYVNRNPLHVDGPAPAVLRAWGDVATRLRATWPGEAGAAHVVSDTGTTDAGWAGSWLTAGRLSMPVGRYGSLACDDNPPAAPLTGTVALIPRGTCKVWEKVARAQRFGAAAVIVYTTQGGTKIRFGADCGECPKLPVTMIGYDEGAAIEAALAAGNVVTVDIEPLKLGADAFAIDQRGRLREFGTIPFPWNNDPNFISKPLDPLRQVALEARAYHHEHAIDMRLASEDAAGKTTTVTLWQDEWMSDLGWSGVRSQAEVEFPDAAAMRDFDKLEFDLELKCDDGNRKGRCPAWDYLVNLYLCEVGQERGCRGEFGRWITAYWSGGRWVTDATPLLGVIAGGGKRRFEFYTTQRYQVTLKMRLTDTGQATAPKLAFPLYGGGGFWNGYNDGRRPYDFTVPDWASRTEIAALITGHGGGDDQDNCAEFCNHTHHWQVNGKSEHVKAHPEAGSELGCLERIDEGVVPNQAGTWIYGRGGWCPGQDVPPWRADITADVHSGPGNQLTYRGLLAGKPYVPRRAEGTAPDAGLDDRIDMSSWLVFYGPKALDVASLPAVPAPGQWRSVWLPMLLRLFDRAAGE